MKSRIHPTYKTQYRVTNWAEYEQGLVRRGPELHAKLSAMTAVSANEKDSLRFMG